MRAGLLIAAGVAALLGAAAASAQSPPDARPEIRLVVKDVWLLRGSFPPRREPDGNTVIFRAPEGLIVFDTGRHPWHQEAILQFARSAPAPIVAIVNSHWHLDHTGGNARLLRDYPAARVIASRAIEGALTGFLPKSATETRAYLASGKADPETAEDLRGDLAVIEDPAALRPDVPIERSQRLVIAGRPLDVRLAPDAATAGDVWLYDPKARVAAVGDLVTLPAPFLDTACPAGWRRALGEIWATPFQIALPGHGPAMTRATFAAWRSAFDALMDCSASSKPKESCAGAWVDGVRPLLDPGKLALDRATGMTEDYIDLLRANGGKSPFCRMAG